MDVLYVNDTLLIIDEMCNYYFLYSFNLKYELFTKDI